MDERATRVPSRDSLLDAIKALAIVRIVLWHTWSWWWLSWIAAMPAMFFASGALLGRSLEHHGYRRMMRSRLRRLLIPFWFYAACSVALMSASGWRPNPGALAPWVLPFSDPVGPATMAGLWIPLWYLRAYLWFLVAATLLRRVSSLGPAVVFVPTAATVALWLWASQGAEIPMAVTDATAFSVFVLAGMLYQRGRRPSPGVAAAIGLGTTLAALVWWGAFGPSSKVVNSSYPLLILTGGAFIGLLLAASALSHLTGRPARIARLFGSRALSIYLWQGLGLLAADRLVTRHAIGGAAGELAALTVVVVVTAACVWAFGWIEDLAAGRPARAPQLRLASLGSAGAAFLILAVALRTTADGAVAVLPPSGQAVIARGERIPDLLRGPAPPTGENSAARSQLDRLRHDGDPAVRVQATLDAWVKSNRPMLRSIGTRRIDAVVVDPSGTVLAVRWSIADGGPRGVQPWWSMSKVVTTAWLAQLVDEGIVTLDDPISRFLPDVPHGDDITLENLARHQSGIPSEFGRPFLEANPRDELHTWFEDPRLAFPPGAGFEYSRLGYYLLAWALEEASGRSWEEVVRDFGERAGVHLVIDEDVDPLPEPTHPGTGTYHGRLWSSGGILASADDSARFFRWLMTDGVSPTSRATMTTFANDKASWFYGLALLPLCPCEEDGAWLRSSRYGLDSLLGSWAFDETTTATVFVDPDTWFTKDGPRPEFYDLESSLLDVAG